MFDFGLCKSLEDKDKAKGYGYRITPYTGTVPYMAPEIAKLRPYDQAADVFSFAILLWEILALRPAFRRMTLQDYLIRVCSNNERPRIHRSWPKVLRTTLAGAWNVDPLKRPSMYRLASLLLGCLQSMTDDIQVLSRAEDRSSKSNNKSARFYKQSKSSMSAG